jgi:predicted enzyme related to lactoylglutathione lyase
MKLFKLSWDLVVEDVNRSVEFYVNLLGWEKLYADENFAKVKAGESELMIMSKTDFEKEMPEVNRPKNEGLTVMIIEVDNIEEAYNKIKDKVKIIRGPKVTDYGTKEFDFIDPDGYIVQFTQR